MNPTRRGILTAAAWAAPVVTVVKAAPTFATSDPAPVECEPTGCKRPGKGKHTKDYYVRPGCDAQVLAVHIDERRAELTPHGWAIFGQRDSRHHLPVVVTTTRGQWVGVVVFPPCGTGAES